jgi:hypothetical protein
MSINAFSLVINTAGTRNHGNTDRRFTFLGTLQSTRNHGNTDRRFTLLGTSQCYNDRYIHNIIGKNHLFRFH